MNNIECLRSISAWVNKHGENAGSIDWAIDQLRWRRVEDELPEERGLAVLVCTENGNPTTAIFYGLAWNGKSDERGPPIWSVRGNVTHWRPIELPGG